MAAYAARFSVVKTPRKLVWMKGLGTVDLSLTVGAQDVDFTVAPVQAAIIMHFKVCAQPLPRTSSVSLLPFQLQHGFVESQECQLILPCRMA